jgi:D-sedoheptulose 7-phosphate isomerase
VVTALKESGEMILNHLLQRFPELEICQKSIIAAFNLTKKCYINRGKLLICGNGGSAADAEHIVGELMKGFLFQRKLQEEEREKLEKAMPQEWTYFFNHLQGALPAISLVSHSALATAYVNDVEPEMVFAQQVYGYGKTGDVLLGLSTSGNSKNVVNAIKVAQAFGMRSIGLTGQNGGLLEKLCQITIKVPATATYRVQEYHLPIYHTLCAMLETEFFKK